MIVDLMRNDLSRVCAPGTVRVLELFGARALCNGAASRSTVVGDLLPATTPRPAARGFPGGSITGAPSTRHGDHHQARAVRARVYCGAIGYWSVTGPLDTSIAIRTAVARDAACTSARVEGSWPIPS